ncbi:hypothetical protein A3H10_00425 [Candidatus Uhrbacteria bacterium RIFCSPLOWO2_12_FULL_46_10]|uniref:Alanine dehydrogenase/pyridine nucleotide transhydrogenase NAD(H)-binding domain-containing protein n=1 Tax=Candidatus Uhrbacteria bacterium RIFCSPLOWO2_01_FULL_47_25 TaxID=1802402 RepID=A0A1F7US40_9BACT|nr:MAG: hydroxyacid dehydrogenase [Parcubacteria group bacterium GW2011_GWA2_46_9]OGL59278.1 MAG: hypothetical protein A2752_01245 [Candidatus Uhrbacteria bacterium RIFCSPHIGHO2_01_FULL_46_23]OGL68477.1 MAG: hypothetical protein A3D60_02570 [Candidatus Uhrbacteria bacterium RIFCSPHIGHO2_02_FULL_47_29]OGL75596.1 MAG: hypothetical protein A3E96_00965 [Candidatus Uhrbacteria bacterium RIFCSPHIGHO2_12_FULL_46_13]OGL81111.1 MAG: hypothetical protein A2936_00730 [Candidatus Uhrbacteria bacterium RIFC
MQIIAFFATKSWEEEYLKDKLKIVASDLTQIFIPEILSKEHLPSSRDFALCSVFVDSLIDRTVIDALPNLKFIVTRSTGYDHIDLAAAGERGIVISSVPSYGENTVAEYAFALLLTLSRKIYDGAHRVREETRFSFDGLQGFDLKGKTIGVLGTGRIGRHAIRMAKGFDMRVVAYDPFPNESFAKEFDFTYLSFEEVLKNSDIITIHVPYSKETHHLINEKTIALMKPGAYLINTSRGGVVDTPALAVALKQGRLGGAGLDVLEEEGVIKDELDFIVHGHPEEHSLKTVLADHVLMDLSNVIVTPHNAFNTKEALTRILDTTVEDIVGYIKGKPVNVVPR